MSENITEKYKIDILNTFSDPFIQGAPSSGAIGKIVEVNVAGNGISKGDLVLLRTADKRSEKVTPEKEDLLKLPGLLNTDEAPFFAPLVFGLWAWDQLNLEIGEVALVAGDHPYCLIILQIALWRGALPIIALGMNQPVPEQVDPVEINHEDPEKTVDALKEQINGKNGFAAIDLSGQAGIIDILLNTVPTWGRLLFASANTEPITIDYYNNMHRSGSDIISTHMIPDNIFEWLKEHNDTEYFVKAYNILNDKALVEDLHHLLK